MVHVDLLRDSVRGDGGAGQIGAAGLDREGGGDCHCQVRKIEEEKRKRERARTKKLRSNREKEKE